MDLLIKITVLLIEINWDFKGNFLSLPVEHDFFFNDLKTMNISGFEISTPSIYNDLLMLCIHSAKHNWSRLVWICDISESISINKIDWDSFIKKSDELEVKRIFLISLLLAKDLFEAKLPEIILDILKEDFYAINMADKIKKQLFLEENLNIFEKFILDLNKRENLSIWFKRLF